MQPYDWGFDFWVGNLGSNKKYSSFIVPSGWLTARMYETLRSSLLDSCYVNKIVHLPYDVFPDAYIDTIIFVLQKTKQPSIDTQYTNVFRFKIREDAQIIVSNKLPYIEVENSIWKADIQHRFLTTDSNISRIQSKLNNHKIEAGKLLEISRGITPFKEIANSSINATKGFFGSVGRYELDGELKTVLYDNTLAEFKPEKYFKGLRLIIRRIISRQHRIHATLISEDFVINKSYLPAIQIDLDYSLFYILSVINSRLFSKSFIWSSEIAKRDDFPQLDIATVKELPIYHISFTTPADRRAALVDEAKSLYSEYLGAPDSMDRLLDFVGLRLAAEPEESDVVHDFLAHLAERMIEMNKEKNTEIKSFLGFVEGDIGAAVDDMANKTAVREYYNHEFQKLIDILVKNRKKLRDGYDPKTPTNYRHLNEWYNDSVDKLQPLRRRIEATDELIDQIVYRLYGLTKGEIEIVEKSIR
jgi:type I restriction-modification system DNA methylase subunit